VIAARVSGLVLVKAKGAGTFAPLRQARPLPMGATIDATRGQVSLVTASARAGRTQSGVFSKGAFTIFQERSDRTDLRLIGGRSQVSVCPAARAAKLSTAVLRLLRGNAHGHFRTVGQFSAATVRGTEWETIDRCDGTLTADLRGSVTSTTDELTFLLEPGQTTIAYCFPPGATPLTRQYCILELSQAAQGLFGFGIGVRRADTSYQLCITGPSGTERCRPFALAPPNAAGVETSAVVCPQDEGPGPYTVRWLLGGQQLGIALPFSATIPRPSSAGACVSKP
jgi:hypothetical protein